MLASSSTTRIVPPAPGWVTAEILSPVAAVDDLILGTAAPAQRRRRLVGRRPPEGHRPDGVVFVGDPERRPQRQKAVEDPEEEGTEALVDGGEQDGHRRHPAVDVPVGDRPAGLV